jgi:hypothetical protein
MPVYEFKCPNCSTLFEIALEVHNRDEVPVWCVCKNRMERQIAKPGVAFKGHGFYTTDKDKK